MRDLRLILGGPGCGKTTRLIAIVEEELESGIGPEEIAYVSFTKAAANEARERTSKSLGIATESLPWFRTIHSLAYQVLGMTRSEIIDDEDWKVFADLVGDRITGGGYDPETGRVGGAEGDRMLRVQDYAASTGLSLEEAFDAVGDESLNWYATKRFAEAYQAFKLSLANMDFTDLLTVYAGEDQPLHGIRVAIIDEAQDLTPVQWSAVEVAFRRCERVYIGGDDDQAIYRWSGSDVDHFLALSDRPEVLGHSYRLPRRIWEVGQRIAVQISKRYAKPYGHNGEAGSVDWHSDIEAIDLRSQGGTWLLLARNGYMLSALEDIAKFSGIPYRTREGPVVKDSEVQMIRLWQELQGDPDRRMTAPEARSLFKALGRPKPSLRELSDYAPLDLGVDTSFPWPRAFQGIPEWRTDFYLDCLRAGESLTDPPRVRVDTIHGVKGAEADHVVILSDISARTARSMEAFPDSEHRVFYTGVTRARRSLEVIAPSTFDSYPIPI